jgi:hypothetical protein
MHMNKILITIICLLTMAYAKAQVTTLNDVLNTIQKEHPQLKMYDADIRSMDAAAKGARTWMPPEFGAGFYMTPYNPKMWKSETNSMTGMPEPGMGSFMLSSQQMFPNKKRQDAEAKYMEAMSSVEKERKNATINDLYAEAKKNYYEWIVIEKKLTVIAENEKVLNFMIKNAEIRFRNGMDKLSAYYKAKASLGNLETMRVMMQAEVVNKRIALNTIMNRTKSDTFSIDTTYIIKDYNLYFDTTTLAGVRSDVKAIERNIALTQFQQDLEKTKLRPEFGIKYDHMFAWAKQPWQFSLMAMAKVPIGRSTRMNKANIESLKWKSVSLSQQRQMILNEATGMAYTMSNEISSRKKQLWLYENNIIPALRNNYKSMQLAYEQNTEELFMLFDAWETLNMTQLSYLEQLQQLLLLQVEFDKILETK